MTTPAIPILAVFLVSAVPALAIDKVAATLKSGREVYQAACVACHGSDGKGMPQTIAGFTRPDSFPDFTRCDQTTPELNKDYKAVITNGGPYHGFSAIMPAFRDALTERQIDWVVHYLRAFCREPGWPRGELNLPRALVTEKAYPEDEEVITTSLNAKGAPQVENEIVHEQRFREKNQIEVALPVNFVDRNHVWYGGFGDLALGLKRVVFSNLQSGSILSVQGEADFATGNAARGLGSGVATFQTFAAFGQLFPHWVFAQAQVGSLLPMDTSKSPRSLFWRGVLGQSLMENHGLGRMWSPMVEMLAQHDFQNASKTDWDILPQLQVTLSRRQHVRADVGVRLPVTNTAGRDPQILFYLLWDWADGKLTEGW